MSKEMAKKYDLHTEYAWNQLVHLWKDLDNLTQLPLSQIKIR